MPEDPTRPVPPQPNNLDAAALAAASSAAAAGYPIIRIAMEAELEREAQARARNRARAALINQLSISNANIRALQAYIAAAHAAAQQDAARLNAIVVAMANAGFLDNDFVQLQRDTAHLERCGASCSYEHKRDAPDLHKRADCLL